jgi:hypothetical protein
MIAIRSSAMGLAFRRKPFQIGSRSPLEERTLTGSLGGESCGSAAKQTGVNAVNEIQLTTEKLNFIA